MSRTPVLVLILAGALLAGLWWMGARGEQRAGGQGLRPGLDRAAQGGASRDELGPLGHALSERMPALAAPLDQAANAVGAEGEGEVAASAGTRSDSTLEPGAPHVEVLVVDPHGLPVPRAWIAERSSGPDRSDSRTGVADGEGLYRRPSEAGTLHHFRAKDPAGRWRSVSLRDIRPGSGVHELRLGIPVLLELEVRAPSGEPIEVFQLEVRTESETEAGVFEREALAERGSPTHRSRPRGDRHPGGRARVSAPDVIFSVGVDAEGYDLAELGPFDPLAVPSRAEVVLRPLPGLSGRVLGPDGPLRGARVTLHEARGRSITVNGFSARSLPSAVATTWTDAAGRFRLVPREQAAYFVRAEAPSLAPGDIGPFEVVPGIALGDLELELGRGGSLTGRVSFPPGERSESALVGISRGDGKPRTARLDAEGRYRFEGLTAGRWQVELVDEESGTAGSSQAVAFGDPPDELPWSCLVREGEVTVLDIDADAVTLGGWLLFDGVAPSGWRATLFSAGGGSRAASAELDGEGRFELRARRAGEHVLTLSRGGGRDSHPTITQKLELVKGQNRSELDLVMGRLGVYLGPLTRAGAAQTFVARQLGVGVQFVDTLDPEGRALESTLLVPAGPVRVVCIPSEGPMQTQDVEVPAGGRATLELP